MSDKFNEIYQKSINNPEEFWKNASEDVFWFKKPTKILNKSNTLPFAINNQTEATETNRLNYRYLDLRRPIMQERILARSLITKIIRQTMDENSFLEFETPYLYKSTPEGAREFLVPSRLNPREFYALPQSPQLFKQLIMISGFDRYYQIVKCFRDEDLRADRQPEFTQIDCEMAFVTTNIIFETFERIVKKVTNTFLKKEILDYNFPKITFADAKNILLGPDNAATNYLEQRTTSALYSKFNPVIKQSFSKVGADQIWTNIINCLFFGRSPKP